MRTGRLEDMVKGWFVGNFSPSMYKTNEVEVAVKTYKAGDSEKKHFHKLATELTLILSGSVRMFDRIYKAGDIVVVEPFEATDFYAIEDTTNVVVKIPGANNDKYEVEEC